MASEICLQASNDFSTDIIAKDKESSSVSSSDDCLLDNKTSLTDHTNETLDRLVQTTNADDHHEELNNIASMIQVQCEKDTLQSNEITNQKAMTNGMAQTDNEQISNGKYKSKKKILFMLFCFSLYISRL